MGHRLLKIFVDADTNKDGLVSKASFFKMIEGYLPEGTSIYADDAEKEASLLKMFNEMDLKYTGVISFDEWLTFCLQQRGVQGLRHQGCRPRLRGAHRALLVPPGD